MRFRRVYRRPIRSAYARAETHTIFDTTALVSTLQPLDLFIRLQLPAWIDFGSGQLLLLYAKHKTIAGYPPINSLHESTDRPIH